MYDNILTKVPENKHLQRALLISQGLALLWWGGALLLRNAEIIPVWFDQERIFRPVVDHILNPYVIYGFFNPPWATVLFAPFALLPLPLSVLLQLCLYFAALTLVIFKFGGRVRHVIIVLTSFLAFDNALELNIEWMTSIGLILPLMWSGPLLLVKPQNALGYYAGFPVRRLIRPGLVAAGFLLITLLIWGWWPGMMLEAIRVGIPRQTQNIAPMSLMPVPLSILLGIAVLWLAQRRKDPVIGILGWVFFAPYITLYSLLLHFAVATARWPRVMLMISVVIWIAYGSILGRFFLSR